LAGVRIESFTLGVQMAGSGLLAMRSGPNPRATPGHVVCRPRLLDRHAWHQPSPGQHRDIELQPTGSPNGNSVLFTSTAHGHRIMMSGVGATSPVTVLIKNAGQADWRPIH
jgi:hypothetical protein